MDYTETDVEAPPQYPENVMPGEADGCGRECNGDPAYPHPGEAGYDHQAGYDQASYGHQGDQGGYPQDGDDPEGYGEPLAQVAADPLEYVSQDAEHTIDARFDFASQMLIVEDLASTNGTLLNGQRISGRQPVRPGDVVTIGTSQLQALPAPATAPAQLRTLATALLPALPAAAAPPVARPPAAAPAGPVPPAARPQPCLSCPGHNGTCKTRPAVRADATACGNASDGGWW